MKRVLFLLLVLAGCGSTQPAAEPDLQGHAFVAESVSEQGKPRPMADGTQVSLDFTDDGRLLAQAGCNMISGPVATGDGRLTANDLAITEMGCDQARHEQDSWLVGVIESKPAWQFDGTTLKLTSADTEIVLTAKKDLPLTGTTWQLDTIIEAEAEKSASGTTLVFNDNKVSITTDCNSGNAQYQVSGDRITFSGAGFTRKACPDEMMAAEQAIAPVLDGEVAFKIENDTLRLSGRDKALRLRGQ